MHYVNYVKCSLALKIIFHLLIVLFISLKSHPDLCCVNNNLANKIID